MHWHLIWRWFGCNQLAAERRIWINKQRGTAESGQDFINQLLIMSQRLNHRHLVVGGGCWMMSLLPWTFRVVDRMSECAPLRFDWNGSHWIWMKKKVLQLWNKWTTLCPLVLPSLQWNRRLRVHLNKLQLPPVPPFERRERRKPWLATWQLLWTAAAPVKNVPEVLEIVVEQADFFFGCLKGTLFWSS